MQAQEQSMHILKRHFYTVNGPLFELSFGQESDSSETLKECELAQAVNLISLQSDGEPV